MKPTATITDNVQATAGDLQLPASVIALTISNEGLTTIFYSWGTDSYNRELLPGESRAFGGFADYTLGTNHLFWKFSEGKTGKKLVITKFTSSGIC